MLSLVDGVRDEGTDDKTDHDEIREYELNQALEQLSDILQQGSEDREDGLECGSNNVERGLKGRGDDSEDGFDS